MSSTAITLILTLALAAILAATRRLIRVARDLRADQDPIAETQDDFTASLRRWSDVQERKSQ